MLKAEAVAERLAGLALTLVGVGLVVEKVASS